MMGIKLPKVSEIHCFTVAPLTIVTVLLKISFHIERIMRSKFAFL